MKRKLFFAVLCIASALSFTAKAQWTGNPVGAGTYYLYNVGSGLYFGGGTSWGTKATLIEEGIDINLTANGNGYSLDTKLSNGGNNHYFTGEFCDGAATPVYFTETSAGSKTYLMSMTEGGTSYIGYDGSNKAIVSNLTDASSENAHWKLVTKDERLATLGTANTNNGVDATFLLPAYRINRNDTRLNSWTMTKGEGGSNTYNVYNDKGPNYPNRPEYAPEIWNQTFQYSTSINEVPNGVYELRVAGFGRGGRTILYANSTEVPMSHTFSGDYAAAMTAILNGTMTWESTGRFQVTDGTINLGIKRTAADGSDWTVFNNFRLIYYGPYDSNEPNVNVPVNNPVPVVDGTSWTLSADAAFNRDNNCGEYYQKSGATVKQTLENQPAGYYTLTAVAFTRTDYVATISAGGKSMNIATVPSTGGTAGVDYCNNLTDAGKWFNAGNGVNKLTFRLSEDGNIEICLTAATQENQWTVWRSFDLVYHGEYPKSVTQQFLADAVAEAQGLYASLPTAAQAALQAVVDAKNISYSTGMEYSDAADDVIAAIAVARPFIDPYARFKTVKANVVALKDQTTKYTDPGTAVSTFDAAVAAQQTAVDEATTAAAIETAIVNLRKAASAFAGNVDIVAGQYLDMTDAMLYNASMRNSGDLSLWTIVSNTNASYPKYANNCSEFWGANFDFYQTAYELPAGNYNIEVSAFHRAAQEGSTYHTFLYANSDQVLVLPLANGENNTAQAEASFNAGLYTNSIKVTLANAIDVNIGFKNEDTADDKRENGAATDKWTIFRDFKIKYFGDDALALYRDEYEGALTAATEALADATYTNVGGTDRSNLSTAVNTTYPTSVVEVDETQEKFETATSNLTALTTTFKNGVASWNNYANTRAGVATAKAEADLFNTSIYTDLGLTEASNASEAAAKAASDEPAIRVATYNYVSSNYAYSLTSKIGDFSTWTPTATVNGQPATAQTLDGEHWSNTTRTYYEQANTGWGSNAWTVQYQKVANNLPAGNYVLKLAARGSVDTHGTIASSATANTVTLPSAGNNTRGITTAGVASWSDSDAFRKSAGASTEDNKGAGWQWRFLPFTVSEAGDVTLTIEAHTDLIYNWVSLADAELLSDEDKTTKITLSDASDMASTIASNDGELATVTLQRGIKVGYNTVVLPFDLTAVQVQAVFGTGAVVYSYSEDSENANSAELTFTTLGSGAITANVPVLVKATSAATEKVIEGVTIEAPTTTAAEGTNFDYVGVYDNTTFAAGDYFMATKDNVQQIFQSEGNNDTAKPFRAYFKKKGDAHVKATLLIDGVATSISEINGDNNDAAAKIFNLAGQRVQKAQKGIYIVNGKKVVIK